jgi:glycosyltransferase involved in cell wall biosynthesis
MPLVSVLLPVYNRDSLVGDAIRSIQNQTFKDWELIILDDGSTDKTLEVCRSFEAQNPRIRVYSNEQNMGIGETRTRLISYATGEYLAIQDSDDVSAPERLASELEVLQTRPEIGLVTVVAEMLNENNEVLQYYPVTLHKGRQFPQNKKEMVKLLYFGSGIEGTGYMFRRSLLNQIPNPYGQLKINDDWYFFIQVAHKTLMWGIPEVLIAMKRGSSHVHLAGNQKGAQQAAIRYRRIIYEQYKNDPESPIDFWLYRKTLATSLIWRARTFRGWQRYRSFLQAVAYDPTNSQAWKGLWNCCRRGFRKGVRLLFQLQS